MRISNLYPNILIKNNHFITKVTDNSKEVISGAIFVAIKGSNFDGADYISEAITKGAQTIITSIDYQSNNNINIIKTKNPKKELASILKKMYYNRLKNFRIVGITGTNGKTSCCNILYKYLLSLNKKVICFSSNGIYVGKKYYETINTTPHILTIYNTILNSSYKNGYIILEISSQAISEMRVFGIPFDIIAYTNITQDHLDYHSNQTDYFYTKMLLMFQVKKGGSVIVNNNIENFAKILNFCSVTTYEIGKNKSADFYYEIVDSSIEKTLFFINTKTNINALETPLIGEFNIQNITLVYAILDVLNTSLDNFDSFIKNIQRINGRMNIFNLRNRTFIIDYAHTEKAVEEVLKTIKSFTNSKIKLIIGCGGNRDRLKRPKIGQLACQYADYVYFTEDNSRTESIEKIINEIICDLTMSNYTIILSRFEAIRKALKDSKENETIILMGMGIDKTKVDNEQYSDLEMVLKFLKEENND